MGSTITLIRSAAAKRNVIAVPTAQDIVARLVLPNLDSGSANDLL